MAAYLALQIIKGNLDYEKVMSKYGKYKEEIDTMLVKQGKDELIVL